MGRYPSLLASLIASATCGYDGGLRCLRSITIALLLVTSACGQQATLADPELPQSGVPTPDTKPASESAESPLVTIDETKKTTPSSIELAFETGEGMAELLRDRADEVAETSSAAGSFIKGSATARLDELGSASCVAIPKNSAEEQLGVAGVSVYDDALTDEERDDIELGDWLVAFGALVGIYCPERLPELDLTAPELTGETEFARFRAAADDLPDLPVAVTAFLADLSDEQLDSLQATACAAISPDLSADDLGAAIISTYDSSLSPTDQLSLSLADYGELFGMMVGWFCPELIPR